MQKSYFEITVNLYSCNEPKVCMLMENLSAFQWTVYDFLKNL